MASPNASTDNGFVEIAPMDMTPAGNATAEEWPRKSLVDWPGPTDETNDPGQSKSTKSEFNDAADAKSADPKSKDGEELNSADREPEEPAIDLSKTQEVFHRYIKRFRLYDKETCEYKPYDLSTRVVRVKEDEDPNNYFYVDARYQNTFTEPLLVITHISKTLVQLLRSLIGDQFFYSDPEYSIKDLFPNMYRMRKALISAQRMVSLDTSWNSDDTLNLAKSLGYLEDGDSSLESGIKNYVSDVVEHLSIFMGYLDEQFKQTAEKLALVTSHGYIEFDLLQYFFEPGQQVTTTDDFELLICFEIENRYYCTDMDMFGNMSKYFTVTGHGREWNGYKYTKREITRKIKEFTNLTVKISSLLLKHSTPQDKGALKVRGQLYTTFSGVHYRLNEGNRVIVDRIAYDIQGEYIRDPNQIFPDLDENLLHLLPSEVYGFNLAKKQWTSFLVEKLRPVVFDEKAWDHLVLDDDIKTLIKGLVEVTKNANSSSKMISDVISGKGGGLISVLHGPPGTGKTLTAESVAEILRRPLYMVGSSELPTYSAGLETKLRDILSLATAWDAVLLIDEADVFLEQRSLHEIERNALVSVALRLLEYHRGVLFLTTNRIKTFDDAFLSRFSIAIKYPELDRAGRYTIWCKFLQLAGSDVQEMVAEDGKGGILKKDVDELAAKEFNGRTIKNLVRTAQALALSTNSPLTVAHLKVVVRAQEKFLDEFSRSNR